METPINTIMLAMNESQVTASWDRRRRRNPDPNQKMMSDDVFAFVCVDEPFASSKPSIPTCTRPKA